MILSVLSLDAFYDQFQALHGVSLEVPTGTIHALLGRNGAGKTTAIRAIFGLVETRAGTIAIDGTPLGNRKLHRLSETGLAYVPENRGVFTGLTVLENMRLVEKRGSRWPMERALDLFPALKDLLRRSGAHLSGGEQQMLVIARALMSDPKFLLLDEPSQGLAPIMIERVMDALCSLRSEDIGVLIVEQNAGLALELADEVSLLEQGEIVFRGRPGELRANETILRSCLGPG